MYLVLFRTLYTESGHRISLTPLHLIARANDDQSVTYVYSKELHVGDRLVVVSNGSITQSNITEIVEELKQGYFAPATTTGMLK